MQVNEEVKQPTLEEIGEALATPKPVMVPLTPKQVEAAKELLSAIADQERMAKQNTVTLNAFLSYFAKENGADMKKAYTLAGDALSLVEIIQPKG